MDDPWGHAAPPSQPLDPLPPLPPRLARLAGVNATGVALEREDPYDGGFADAAELPEVQALLAEGWELLESAPLYFLLPAAWPPALRTWVPDRLPRVEMGATSAGYFGSVVPASTDAEQWPDDYVAQEARAAGLPEPPPGRIWLLRSPWPRIPLAVIHEIVWAVVQQRRDPEQRRSASSSEAQRVYDAAREVLGWDEARALAACAPETRARVDAWAGAGRTGAAAAMVLERGLLPDDLDRLEAGTGLDEATALAWLDSLQADVDDAIAFIVAWRSTGLPGNPPPGARRYRERDPQELQAWLAAGFDLYAADRLHRAGPDTAITWREAGFDEADTYVLLRSDPALTPDEARAFDEAGIAREARADWVYFGFTATEAAAWSARGLWPEEARLWRASGHQPADAEPGQRIPPELIAGRRYLALSGGTGDGRYSYSEWDELADPPGTRGRRARRWAHDPDPWINDD